MGSSELPKLDLETAGPKDRRFLFGMPKTMITMHQLREMHLLHLHIRDFRQRAEQAPRQLKKFQTKVDLQKKKLADLHEEIKHLKVAVHDKEVTLKGNEQKITKYEQQRNQATTKKEYDAFIAEIGAQKKANTKLEDDILEAMSAVEQKTALIRDHEKSVKAAEEEHHKAEDELSAQRPDWDKRLAEAQEALRAIEAEQSAEQKSLYDRLVKSYGADALAEVREGTCTGCNIDLTPQGRQNLDNAFATTCKNCGRLLYLPE
jgi:predicted  nucleic acid-binding Zn-ribbon protein